MTVEAAVRAMLADVPDADLIVADPTAGVAGTIDRLRRTRGGFVLLLVASRIAALDRAMLLAAIGPLAAELAPRVRIGAVVAGPAAAAADVAAAAGFLARARSTTGQVLEILAEG